MWLFGVVENPILRGVGTESRTVKRVGCLWHDIHERNRFFAINQVPPGLCLVILFYPIFGGKRSSLLKTTAVA